nr:formate dehydrogenase accessory sulfurtransferase FdhD [uncultured Sphingomonas sp.]
MIQRAIAVEAPVSVEVCGIAYAVMMATPADLDDYAAGFALSEGLISDTSEIESIGIHQIEGGWALRIWLPPDRKDRVLDRVRTRVSESSCGLCGIENIEEVLRALPPVTASIRTDRAALVRALHSLRGHQPLSRATGAVHAAAFCTPDGQIHVVREDVGRHNALDKLIGSLARSGTNAADGFILLSARCSYELVEKTARAGCPMLVTISAPTSLAVERASAAGMTLISLARSDSALIICDEKGMVR